LSSRYDQTRSAHRAVAAARSCIERVQRIEARTRRAGHRRTRAAYRERAARRGGGLTRSRAANAKDAKQERKTAKASFCRHSGAVTGGARNPVLPWRARARNWITRDSCRAPCGPFVTRMSKKETSLLLRECSLRHPAC